MRIFDLQCAVEVVCALEVTWQCTVSADLLGLHVVPEYQTSSPGTDGNRRKMPTVCMLTLCSEMKYIIAALYSNYRTTIVDDSGIGQSDSYTAPPKSDKLMVRLERLA